MVDSYFLKGRALVLATFLVCWAVPESSFAIEVGGDPADYEAQRQDVSGSPATVSADRGTAEELRVMANDTGGFLFEESRPVIQFDLSILDGPAQSVVLHMELVSADSNMPFGVEAWGTESNRAGPLAADDPGAPGQFAASGYQHAHGSTGTLVDEGTSPGSVFQDITSYLNDRIDEYQNGGDSWVYLRLQPDANFSAGSGVEAEFSFASADHPDAELRPYLEVVPIPEPRHATFLLLVLMAVFLRLRGTRRCLG